MKYNFLPLQELLCMVPPTPVIKDINIGAMVSSACKFTVPEYTSVDITRKQIPDVKTYLQDVDPITAMQRITSQFNTPELALRSQTAITYLKDALPPSEFELTPTGLRRVVKPSYTEDFKFLWKCRVTENPWFICNLFATHQLTGEDMKCLKSVYAEEHNLLAAGFLEYILMNFSTDAAIPRPLRTMLAIFFDQPTINLQQLAAYQSEEPNNKTTPAPMGAAPELSSQEVPK